MTVKRDELGAIAVCENVFGGWVHDKPCSWQTLFAGEEKCPNCGGDVKFLICCYKYCRELARYTAKVPGGVYQACAEHKAVFEDQHRTKGGDEPLIDGWPHV